MRRVFSFILVFALAATGWCQSDWFGVFIKGKKAGYVTFDDKNGEKGPFRESISVLSGKMLGADLEIKVTSRTWANPDGKLTRMEVDSTSGGKTQNVVAVVEGDEINATSTMDGRTSKARVAIPKGAQIVDDPMSIFLKGGQLREVYVFDSTTLGLVKCNPVSKGTEKVSTPLGDVEATVIDMQDPRSPLKVYLSTKGDIIKAVGPFGMEIVPLTKEDALAETEGVDVADASSVVPDREIKDFLGTKSLQLEVSGHDLSKVPSDDHQTVTKSGEKWLLNIHPVQPESIEKGSSGSIDPKWLESDQHIPSGNDKFKKKAKEIVGETRGLLERVEKLRLWVQGKVRANAGMGVLRDADDILESGDGVCRDHAILLATLLRADSIPTRLVSGMVYANSAFYYHAWVEVWTGSKWLGVDSTRPTKGLDATHIKIAQGTVGDVFTSFLLDGITIKVLDR